MDEPEVGTKKPLQAAKPVKAKPVAEVSPLKIDKAVVRLRQPLAPIEVPSAMDVSFGELCM